MYEAPPQRLRFGFFEADVKSGELKKRGTRIPLEAKAFQVLVMLLERSGDTLTRQEICDSLWPADTLVDFDRGLTADRDLNIAITKLRTALGDTEEAPRFVETMGWRGYRFIGPVVTVDGMARPGAEKEAVRERVKRPAPSARPRSGAVAASIGAALVGVAVIWAAFASETVSSWRAALTPSREAQARQSPAYELYQEGRLHQRQKNPAALARAVRFFEQAIERDKNLALAHAGLASAVHDRFARGDTERDDAEDKVRLAAARSLALAPDLPEAHTVRGVILFQYDRDFAGAERAFQRAIQLDPHGAWPHTQYAYLLITQKRFDQALTEASQAITLDPKEPDALCAAGRALQASGRAAEAADYYRRALALEPESGLTLEMLTAAGDCFSGCACQRPEASSSSPSPSPASASSPR